MKVAVVGGGLAGLMAAIKLASCADCEVVVFEEHRSIGRPVHCAGLISWWTEYSLRRNLRVPVIRSFDCLRVVIGSINFELENVREGAVVIDRELLDVTAFREAEARGVEVRLGNEVKLVRPDASLSHERGREVFDLVVVADGMKGFVKRGGVPLLGVQYEIKTAEIPGTVEIWVDKTVNPDFFGWFIPLSDTTLVGTASRPSHAYASLRAFCKRRFGTWRVLGRRVGHINVNGPVSKLTEGRVILVGDAAGQNKPTTGGGIFMIEVATDLLQQAVVTAESVEDIMMIYERAWREALSKEVRAMKLMRALFASLDQKCLEQAAAVLADDPSMLLSSDMDRQGSLLVSALKRPTVLARLGAVLLFHTLAHGIAFKSGRTKRVM